MDFDRLLKKISTLISCVLLVCMLTVQDKK